MTPHHTRTVLVSRAAHILCLSAWMMATVSFIFAVL